MTYLRDTWYVAAWSSDLRTGEMLGRTILDEPLVLFRDANGRPAALQDLCPHRFAPLSAGCVRGGQIACGYHGLVFDARGDCVLNPHGRIPPNAKVRAYPVHETHRAIWIWMGKANRADPERIPDFSFLSKAPGSAFSCGYLGSEGHYELLVDNILDLSHTDFLHPGTLAGAGITGVSPKVLEADDSIDVTWSAAQTKPPPLLVETIPDIPNDVQTSTRVRWHPASAMSLTVAIVPEGKTEETGFRNHNAHIMTPESVSRTHYFFAATRNYGVEDEALNGRIAAARKRIFETEDKPMIEKIALAMRGREFWDMKPVMLSIDAAPVRVRRRLLELIENEQSRA